MAIEGAMALTNRLLTNAQALAALTAYIETSADDRKNPTLRPHLEKVVDMLGAREQLDTLTPDERAIVCAFARSYMRQALELMEEPHRANAWSHSDPTILQAQGAASAVVARLIEGLGIGGPGIRILDIGTGVAGLAIAFCRIFPDSRVVGVDPWEPSLALARANVVSAGLESRVALHAGGIEDFEDDEAFDLIWLPSFFIPDAVLQTALRATRELLHPGGHLVVGVIEGSNDPLAGAVDAMITVRSGGSVLEPEEAVTRLQRAGFTGVREAERTWQAPLRLVLATT